MWLKLVLQTGTELVLKAAFDGDKELPKDAGPRLAASCLATMAMETRLPWRLATHQRRCRHQVSRVFSVELLKLWRGGVVTLAWDNVSCQKVLIAARIKCICVRMNKVGWQEEQPGIHAHGQTGPYTRHYQSKQVRTTRLDHPL